VCNPNQPDKYYKGQGLSELAVDSGKDAVDGLKAIGEKFEDSPIWDRIIDWIVS